VVGNNNRSRYAAAGPSTVDLLHAIIDELEKGAWLLKSEWSSRAASTTLRQPAFELCPGAKDIRLFARGGGPKPVPVRLR